jgi:hypothetical protein
MPESFIWYESAVSSSNLELCTDFRKIFLVIFFFQSREIPEKYLKLGHYFFNSYSLQFIT